MKVRIYLFCTHCSFVNVHKILTQHFAFSDSKSPTLFWLKIGPFTPLKEGGGICPAPVAPKIWFRLSGF